jgi:hypothetical protein
MTAVLDIEELEFQRVKPTQRNLVLIIKYLTTGKNKKDWCTSGDIQNHLTNKRQMWRNLEKVRKYYDNIECVHSTQLPSKTRGPPRYMYKYLDLPGVQP